MDEKTFHWLKSTPHGIGQGVIDKEKALCEKRENARIEKERHLERKTDRPYKTTQAEMLGRGVHRGIVVECGRFLEVWLSVENIHMGAGQKNSKVSRPKCKEEQAESEESIAARVNHRARKRIRRLVNANDFRDMVTLTIAPPSVENIYLYDVVEYHLQRDYDYVRALFSAFLKRCKRANMPLTYLAVFEQHNSEKTSEDKRFCWHIHMAINGTGVDFDKLGSIWRHGRIDHQDYRYDKNGKERNEDVQNPGAYMAEYIGKDGEQFGNALLRNKRRYTTSRNVKKPVQRRVEDCDMDGFFEYILYEGEEYSQEFFSSKHIPGTDKYSVTVTYMRRQTNE